MRAKQIFFITTISMLSAILSVSIFSYFKQDDKTISYAVEQPTRFAAYSPSALVGNVDFTVAAEHATPAVVHIKSMAMAQKTSSRGNFHNNPFHDFFGDDFFRFWGDRGWQQPQQQPRMAAGSGVIVSPTGYIVTNNHVIKGADDIEVVLNDNISYKATLVGADPSTDIALLKIDAENLPFLNFTNSDSVRVGEWVLAVGNPFNLSSTVTAGIVSAKARNINILEDVSAVESFIQTDAAVNPGNSGGALVNIKGELIGINTAIASPTGAFAGYSFAVPANIVKKVVADIKEFGVVQRGFLGVSIKNIDSELAKKQNLSDLQGVYIENVTQGSAADDAGIKPGDVVKEINGVKINSAPKLQETVAQYRPGNKLEVKYVRDGNLKTTTLVLKNKNQSTELITKETLSSIDILGAEFAELTDKEKKELGVKHGLKVIKIVDGKLAKQTNMKEGFIITYIDRTPIHKTDDIISAMKNKKGGVMIEGTYPNYPGTYYYAFGM
jgi:Do/DeqQ family serine protease